MRCQDDFLRYLIILHRASGVASSKLNQLIDNKADPNTLKQAEKLCDEFATPSDWAAGDKDWAWAAEENCHILPRFDKHYPPLLKEINDPPPLLFVQGDISYLTRPQIALVGSRYPSPTGREIALNFAKHFSSVGLTVTSGLAVGIDTEAHQGALSEKGGTIAVLGSGLDRLYPAANKKLAQEIIEKGALVSEFPLGTPPLPTHFPRRNRIISGLTVGTLVVEAALKSGSLITAKLALDQGREVFAIPGSIYSPLAKGCHALIRQGAKLVETANDVLEELGSLLKWVDCRAVKNETLSLFPLSAQNESLLSLVGFEPTSVDGIMGRSRLTAGDVSIMLLELELQGFVVSVPGGYMRVSM